MLRRSLSFRDLKARIAHRKLEVELSMRGLAANIGYRILAVTDHTLNSFPVENEHLVNGAMLNEDVVN
jgi:hypothetical protein